MKGSFLPWLYPNFVLSLPMFTAHHAVFLPSCVFTSVLLSNPKKVFFLGCYPSMSPATHEGQPWSLNFPFFLISRDVQPQPPRKVSEWSAHQNGTFALTVTKCPRFFFYLFCGVSIDISFIDDRHPDAFTFGRLRLLLVRRNADVGGSFRNARISVDSQQPSRLLNYFHEIRETLNSEVEKVIKCKSSTQT